MRRWLALFAICLTAGCARTELADGDALVDDGAPGQVGIPHTKVGEPVWFALPRFDNRSDEPVHLVDIKLVDPPSQLRVLRYRGQSATAVGWVQLDFRPGGNARENPLNTPEVPIGGIVAPPHRRADGYVMMEVELRTPQRVEMRHVVVMYEVAGQVQQQRLSMDLVIEPA